MVAGRQADPPARAERRAAVRRRRPREAARAPDRRPDVAPRRTRDPRGVPVALGRLRARRQAEAAERADVRDLRRGLVASAAWSPTGTLGLIGISEPSESIAGWAHYHLYVLERAGLRRLARDLDRSIAFLTTGDLYDSAARRPRPPLLLWARRVGGAARRRRRRLLHPCGRGRAGRHGRDGGRPGGRGLRGRERPSAPPHARPEPLARPPTA